jgi:hypothetical protein
MTGSAATRTRRRGERSPSRTWIAARAGIWLLGSASALLVLAVDARATTIWQEDFEAASGLADGNWGSTPRGALSAPGQSSAECLKITGKSALGGTGGAVTVRFNVSSSTDYWISVDYKEGAAGGYLYLKGYAATGNGVKQTIAVFGDAASGALTTWSGSGTTWVHYVQKITTLATVKRIRLQLGDSNGNATPVGHVFFDNIRVDGSPPGVAASVVQWKEQVQ